MRDIKFRAWHELNKRMIDLKAINPLALSLDTNGLFIPFSDGLKLMQFTGLKDKNGKEVYEGDILAFTSQHSKNSGKVFNNAVEYFVGGSLCGFRMRNKSTTISLNKNRMYRAEIIGNIYENPELLQK